MKIYLPHTKSVKTEFHEIFSHYRPKHSKHFSFFMYVIKLQLQLIARSLRSFLTENRVKMRALTAFSKNPAPLQENNSDLLISE